MNTTADHIQHVFTILLGYAAALGLLAALPAVLLVGVTGTDAAGYIVVLVIATLASIAGTVVLCHLIRSAR